MNFSSERIEQAVHEFTKLPGIGKRTALRLVLYFLKNPEQEAVTFSKTIADMRKNIKFCKTCHNAADTEICAICANTYRNAGTLCVVETIREVMAIESTQQYNGLYHVLGGVISPLNGVVPENLNIQSLIERVKTHPVEEVIMALNPTIDGDTTIFYLSKKLATLGVRITTISRGIAFGSELEFVDEVTLARSLSSRLPFEKYISGS